MRVGRTVRSMDVLYSVQTQVLLPHSILRITSNNAISGSVAYLGVNLVPVLINLSTPTLVPIHRQIFDFELGAGVKGRLS